MVLTGPTVVFIIAVVTFFHLLYWHKGLQRERKDRCLHKDSTSVFRLAGYMCKKCDACGQDFYPFRGIQGFEEYKEEYERETYARQAEFNRRKAWWEQEQEVKKRKQTTE